MTNDLKMATSSVLYFVWGETTIRLMPCIFFSPLFPSLNFMLKSLIDLQKGLVSETAILFMLESCLRSRTGLRPVQISSIWTYPVSASWHGAGIQYYRQAGHQMGVGFISVSLSSPHSVPPPLSLASHPSYVSFFSTGQLRQNARELDVLENRTTFQSNTLIDYFFFPCCCCCSLAFL